MPQEKDDKIAEAALTLQMEGNEKLNDIAEAVKNVDKTLEASLVQKMDEEKGAEVRMVDEDGKTFIIKGRRGPPGTPGRPGKDPDENKIIKEVTGKVTRLLPKKEEIEEEVLGELLKKIPTKSEIVNTVRPLIKDGEDGEDSDPKEVAEILKSDEDFIEKTKGEPGKPGKDGSTDSPKELAKKINTLKKEIDWKVLKNVPDMPRNKPGGGGGQDITVYDETTKLTGVLKQLIFVGAGVSAVQIADGNIVVTIPGGSGGGGGWETPVGAVNGINTVFTVLNEPKMVFSDGVPFVDGIGYTYLAGTITMAIPPQQFIRSSF